MEAKLRLPGSWVKCGVCAHPTPHAPEMCKVWSLTVTKNWRMTFRINAAGAIEDMDLEDYH